MIVYFNSEDGCCSHSGRDFAVQCSTTALCALEECNSLRWSARYTH